MPPLSHPRTQTQTQPPRARRRDLPRGIPSSRPTPYTRPAKPSRLYAAKRAPAAAALRSAHALARRVSSLSGLSRSLQGLILPSASNLALLSLRLPPPTRAPDAAAADEATAAMRTMLAALVATKKQEAEEDSEARLRAVLGAGVVVGGRSKFARVRVRRNNNGGMNVNVNGNGARGGMAMGEGWMCGFEVRASA
ncbi:hypothetical protein C8R46DRAFT_1206339 [Mycena filopes]|nr:hypothetical protein C8R46DRAFT_1206339 [Mycena filopes]